VTRAEHGFPRARHGLLAGTLAWSDRLRRARARGLDRLGLGPVETPGRVVLERPGLRLRRYGGPASGPVLLIVPAPIKRHHIWDLMPGRSVVARALAAGLSVHLLEWTGPEGEAAGYGLDEVVERLVGTAVDALAPSVLLAGHSLGGTLAALYAARHPARVRGLVLVEAPLRFAPDAGTLARLAQASPGLQRALPGAVPGTALTLAGTAADPIEFFPARWLDAARSIGDQEALAAHLRVLRWTLDELAMPGPLFADLAGRLFREDGFNRGTLALGGERVGPERLAMPILAVLDPRSIMVPPASVLPFLERTPAAWTVRWHGQETGVAVQHVGALVGRRAHATLWPGILDWLASAWARAPGEEA
jgi:polyhydroxyalkanoate synthase